MKVLLVSNGFPPRGQWGTEFYSHELVQALRGRKHDLMVLHPERTGRLPRYTLEDAVGSEGVPVKILHNPGDPDKAFADSYTNSKVEDIFRELLRKWQPDVVHFTYLLWGLSVRMPIVAREEGVPTVVTLTDYSMACHRGQMFDYSGKRCFGPHPAHVCARCIREPGQHDLPPLGLFAKQWAVRSLAAVGGMGRVVVTGDLERREECVREAIGSVDHLIAPTRVLAETFLGLGAAPEKLTELCYSIREAPMLPARKEPEGKIRFGFLGQFTPHKGLGTLLDAIRIMERRLPESVEPWEVALHGGPTGGRNKLYAGRLFGHDRGPRVCIEEPFPPTECGRILAGLHAVLVPSEWDENAPLTVLQARAAGVPVIGSDVPGIREVVIPGEHGILTPVGDAEALADAMREIVLRRMVRHRNPSLPVSLDDHVSKVESIYAAVKASKAGQASAAGQARGNGSPGTQSHSTQIEQ